VRKLRVFAAAVAAADPWYIAAVPLAGHFWTLAANLRHRVAPQPAPPAAPWSQTLEDPQIGPVRLSGALHRVGADGLVVAIHGLGGDITSHYMIRAAAAATAAGLDCLRLALRGADRLGEDFYHAGLTADLEAALASPALAGYRTVHVVGYSLGGHMTLRWALAPSDPRVRSVASVCAPLDLAASEAAIDGPGLAVYRGHVLSGLKEIYAAVAARRAVPTPWPTIRRVTTIRAWDRHAVVPRFGFCSVDDYYARTSVAPRLPALAVPALIVSAPADPMIPARTIAPHVRDLPTHVVHAWTDAGGHVGFPRRTALGQGLPQTPGLEGQILAWLRRHA
jgi:predicted alpha/beta-fold hydrolase